MFNEAFAGTLPIQGTEVAAKWDFLYYFLVGLSIFFFVLVVGAMIYFVIKYRRREGHKPTYDTGSHLLEAIWVVVPTMLLMIIFAWGYTVYREMKQAPSNSYEIKVVARQWMWTFLYDNGTTTLNELYVPVNQPVKLMMTSEDVIHGFFVPNFRVKQDVVPGMYTSLWFEATVPGKHQIFCTEYCGAGHSGMLAQVIALTSDQWKAWLRGKKITNVPVAGEENAPPAQIVSGNTQQSLTPEELGKKVYETKSCNACHTVDGSPKVGPSWKGIYGTMVELNDGRKVKVDDNYIHESITDPQAKIVKGFGPTMPTFKGVLSEQEIAGVIAYIKSLK